MQQHQEGSYEESQEAVSARDRFVNRDPREQSQQSIYSSIPREHSYEEGYTPLDTENWFQEGEKLQPRPMKQRNGGFLVSLIVLICIALVAGNIVGIILSWLTWMMVLGLIFVGAFLIITNWRVVTVPLPLERFAVQGHTHLIINNFSGDITIRKGEANEVLVASTRKSSGIGSSVQSHSSWVESHQQASAITIAGKMNYSLFQFGFRSIAMEITVPQDCDVQMKTGSGKINIQDVNGNLKLQTGSGSIEANSLRGQIVLSTGSGSVEVANLSGDIRLKSGSGRMTADRLSGDIQMKTGSHSILATALSGSANLVTGSGEIQVHHSELRGNTVLKTGSGPVTMSSSIDALGSYNLHTGSGPIHVELAAPVAFSLKASTGSGKVINEFGSNEVGDGSRPRLTLKTGSGRITIQRI